MAAAPEPDTGGGAAQAEPETAARPPPEPEAGVSAPQHQPEPAASRAEPQVAPAKPATEIETAAAEPASTRAATAVKPEPAQAEGERPRGHTWLNDQRKDHYVIQLMAAHDRQVVEQFIGEQSLGSRAAVFSTRRAGQSWHVLLFGLYANADVARAAINELPAALRRHSPWIRSVASVQQAMRDKTP